MTAGRPVRVSALANRIYKFVGLTKNVPPAESHEFSRDIYTDTLHFFLSLCIYLFDCIYLP